MSIAFHTRRGVGGAWRSKHAEFWPSARFSCSFSGHCLRRRLHRLHLRPKYNPLYIPPTLSMGPTIPFSGDPEDRYTYKKTLVGSGYCRLSPPRLTIGSPSHVLAGGYGRILRNQHRQSHPRRPRQLTGKTARMVRRTRQGSNVPLSRTKRSQGAY